MSAGAPWSVKGIDPKAREIAKDLARRSGMTLGEWLNQMIMDDGQEPPAPPPQARRRFDPFEDRPVPDRFSPIERPAPPVQRLQAEPVEEDDIARIAQDNGIAALAVHGRTRADKYEGEAEYATIAAVKAAVRIPVRASRPPRTAPPSPSAASTSRWSES